MNDYCCGWYGDSVPYLYYIIVFIYYHIDVLNFKYHLSCLRLGFIYLQLSMCLYMDKKYCHTDIFITVFYTSLLDICLMCCYQSPRLSSWYVTFKPEWIKTNTLSCIIFVNMSLFKIQIANYFREGLVLMVLVLVVIYNESYQMKYLCPISDM